MIRYALKCASGHAFDSWFPSGAAYDALRDAGHLACPVCGSDRVEKAPMAPRVTVGRDRATASEGAPDAQQDAAVPANALSAPPKGELARAIAALRDKIERETENVGARFADEARAIHGGEAPERAIRGEATPHEARALLEDGIPVLPLPFANPKKVN
ncbi:DUF1178 domain-containing protein [Meridianimarinicoccus roseus]|jgi:hypothetical protein|uniref:DUF1178 domain-containing protein n=1 Tax=Meridianimarinicoccus roseus TaxID=2072018 RepID=A0A2V2LKK8_9RHOB|nr:DUF1178 family protein [Meridianimarinicoccus roseus]PWR04671.1 DUF1178 domain-containing protein [Meridianimarinicoccus roseus]